MTSSLAATADLAHLLADDLDNSDMPLRPPFEYDMAAAQKADAGEAMRSYLSSLDRQTADTQKKTEQDKINASKALLNKPNLSSPKTPIIPSSSSSTTTPLSGLSSNTTTPTPQSPSLSSTNFTSGGALIRPKSANRDMHLHAAAALAFDGTIGSAASKPTVWAGAARPQTSNSLFQRPGTAYTIVDTEGKEQAQLSLAEQTRSFNAVSEKGKAPTNFLQEESSDHLQNARYIIDTGFIALLDS